ncbi:MAG: NAD(P)-dependent oxidoreductase [Nitrospira sp.]|nr:MAG: NAD(P)-dependent oxidoreductase [Nitrospira sp.]
MKTVLVTGGTGFIGSHCLAPLVARGFEVHAVTSRNINDQGAGVTWHRANLLDVESIGPLFERVRPTHLLHLAWYVVPGKVMTSEASFDWVASSLEMMKAFSRATGVRLVISGSSYEYDWNYGYCNEVLTPKTANTVYGHCKNALRLLMESYAQTHGMTCAWPRIFFLYGPNEHPDRLVSSVIRSVLREQDARCSHGNQIRDYLFVQDVADALVALLDSDVEGAVNIGAGQPTTLREIVTTAGRMMGRPDLIKLGAIPSRANDTPLVMADVGRLTDTLGWKPKYSLEEGLRDTIEWWRTELANGR